MGSKYDGIPSKLAMMEKFNAGNLYAYEMAGLLVVYSYGPHYVLAVGHSSTGRWAICTEPSSRTTGKHRGIILRAIYPVQPVEIPDQAGMRAIISGESDVLEVPGCVIT